MNLYQEVVVDTQKNFYVRFCFSKVKISVANKCYLQF